MRRGRWSGGLRALGRGRRMRRRRRSAYGVRRLARLSAALVWRLSSGRRLGRMLRRGWGSFTAMPGFVRAGPGLSIERAERLARLRAALIRRSAGAELLARSAAAFTGAELLGRSRSLAGTKLLARPDATLA